MSKGGSVILRIYFALVAFVTLMMLIFSVSDLVNIALKSFVFPAADRVISYCDLQYQTQEQCDQAEKNSAEQLTIEKQQSAVRDISLLVVSAPLFWIHWRIVLRDWMEERKKREDEEDEEAPKKK